MVPIKFGRQGQMVPKIWSPWTNGPQSIWSRISGTTQPVPLDKRNILGPFVQETKLVGDHLSMGTKLLGNICPMGLNWLGTIYPEGPINFGLINWGPIAGNQMSGYHIYLGPKKKRKEMLFYTPHDSISSLRLRCFLNWVCFQRLKIVLLPWLGWNHSDAPV